MKKLLIILFFGILLLQNIFAMNLDINKKSSNEVLIYEIQDSVIFELEITNNGVTDNFEFYNLLGFNIYPIGFTKIKTGETKKINLTISPISSVQNKGPYTFSYFIRNDKEEQLKQSITFRVVSLENAFEIGTSNLNLNDKTIDVYIKNNINKNFKNIQGNFKSSFFDFNKEFSLNAYEKKNFNIDLNKQDIEKLTAGFYTLNAELKIKDKTQEYQGVIEFSENNDIDTIIDESGFLIKTKTITKENKGNVINDVSVSLNKNLFERLFTYFIPEPDISNRKGFNVNYIWNQEIKPSEDFKVKIKTNYFVPIIFFILVIVIIVLLRKFSYSEISLKKRVSYVHTKGGEFALKVSILVKANEYVEKVNVIDKLPSLVRLYNKFGAEHPTRINEKSRTLEWNFEKLEQGESRVLSYIVFSKVGVLGKFALPLANAIFEKDGKIKETNSNRVFFMSETKESENQD